LRRYRPRLPRHHDDEHDPEDARDDDCPLRTNRERLDAACRFALRAFGRKHRREPTDELRTNARELFFEVDDARHRIGRLVRHDRQQRRDVVLDVCFERTAVVNRRSGLQLFALGRDALQDIEHALLVRHIALQDVPSHGYGKLAQIRPQSIEDSEPLIDSLTPRALICRPTQRDNRRRGTNANHEGNTNVPEEETMSHGLREDACDAAMFREALKSK
jgi:hypothetical protein